MFGAEGNSSRNMPITSVASVGKETHAVKVCTKVHTLMYNKYLRLNKTGDPRVARFVSSKLF